MIIKQTTELLLGEEVWFQKAVNNNTAFFYLRGGRPWALQLVSQAPPTLQFWDNPSLCRDIKECGYPHLTDEKTGSEKGGHLPEGTQLM